MAHILGVEKLYEEGENKTELNKNFNTTGSGRIRECNQEYELFTINTAPEVFKDDQKIRCGPRKI